ncbi:MAG TPA: 3-deoxy-manno-octulosonate cytidylyltransferase [Elusimicrobiales bacterium]|nr:3-deoxy-manno-octulosonate cytidylyltransferase [Elusimicrobiales bacterium]
MKDTLIVIPARYKSKRFPGKVLAKLGNKTVLQRIYETCVKSKLGEVIVATDDKRIFKTCQNFGAKAVMTPPSCKSGTDRTWIAAKNRPHKYVINVQADMPFIKPNVLKKVHKKLKSLANADIVTAYCKITQEKEIKNPNNVKIVLTNKNKALYFSRSVIPNKKNPVNALYRKHYGIYGFKKKSLEKFIKLKPSKLEIAEKLEQLRALENGMDIYCIETPHQGPTVDTLQDLKKAEVYLKKIKG